MDANDYQKLAARTLIDKPGFEIPDDQIMLVWNALGLVGEAGECADAIKKAVFHQHGIDREKIIREIGDVLWYAAGICTVLGVDLGDAMATNIEKLKLRYPNGFTSADSVKRADV